MIDPKEHEKKLIRLYEDEGATFIKHKGIPGVSQMHYGVRFVEEDEEIVTIKFKYNKPTYEPDSEQSKSSEPKEILSETNQSSETN